MHWNSLYGRCSKFWTLIACQKILDKQSRPRSDCFWRSSLIKVSLLAILTSILWIQTLISKVLFENRKRKVFKILEYLQKPFLGPSIFLNLPTITIWWMPWNSLYRCSKFSNTNCLPKGLEKQCRPRSGLIRVFPVCYSDKHLANPSPDKQHFIWKTEREKVFEILEYLP